ncbi:MAG: NRDE family protein [bacterium]|nr:NRDE family protein [bacterium]
MCTLIVLHRCFDGRPLVVAANRDEFLARPAEDFAIRTSATGPILSPLDLEAGGTWVGLSQRGVFAGLTNLRPLPGSAIENKSASELESRGDVVMMALESESAADTARKAAALETAAYNPFQLLVADGRDAFLVVYRDRAEVLELEAGPHIVGNVEDEAIAERLGRTFLLDGQDDRGDLAASESYPGFEGLESVVDSLGESAREPRALKLTRIRSRVEKMVTEPSFDLFDGLARICREHVGGEGIDSPFEATCVHIPEAKGAHDAPRPDRYGTRSSLLLELSEDEGSSRLWTTDGPPCVRPFENRSVLLKDLGVRLGG